MVWIIILSLIAAICVFAFLFGLISFIFCGGREPMILLIAIIAMLLCGGAIAGIEAIESRNTVIVQQETVEMKITKLDMTSIDTSSGPTRNNFFVTLDNKYLIKVSEKEYVTFSIGDTVKVKVTYKTQFSWELDPEIEIISDET